MLRPTPCYKKPLFWVALGMQLVGWTAAGLALLA